MSTITREFTKEQLQQIIETDHVQCGEASSLARIALASLEAEPVAWLLSGGGAKNNVSFDSGNAYADPLREVTPLYTAPPAPVALTSGYSDFEEIWSSSTHPLTQDDEMKDFAWDIWNACRAAMLQAGNSPVAPDGLLGCGENCWSCGKYFTYEQHSECDGYCPHCNSPVDLDDEEEQSSKVVPTEPTEEMIYNAWREAIGKCDHETIKRIYATMLAAAPQQEVK